MFQLRRKPLRTNAPRRRAIDDLVRSLALIVEPRDLRAALSVRVRELFGCDSVIVCALQPEEAALASDVGFDDSARSPAASFPIGGTLARWLTVNQEPLTIPHPTGAFEYLDSEEQALLVERAVRACIPLLAGDRLLGILLVSCSDPNWQLSSEDRELITRLCRQVGLALENAELHFQERERLKNLHRSEQLAVAGLLAATVAHEVRNPLTAIRSTIQYVMEGSADWDSKAALLGETLSAVDRIERIVGGILALSRSTTTDGGPVNLIEVCEQSLLLIQAYAAAHGIVVERQFELTAMWVDGDTAELNQVFTNLFINACQAMPAGGRLTLKSAVVRGIGESRVMAMIQVRDTGCGIPNDLIRKVFEPFFTTKRSGTGLGLAVCLEIVTKHDGQLRLHSDVGVGTVATVMLPLVAE